MKPMLVYSQGWWSISNWSDCLNTPPNSKERWNVHLAIAWVRDRNKRNNK